MGTCNPTPVTCGDGIRILGLTKLYTNSVWNLRYVGRD
ncbi:hypothetical protein BN903_215 [Halorubrum sp. AJ67]|nr:hypothetical protein BN903_215 [Halorubrum sp. AJ67]